MDPREKNEWRNPGDENVESSSRGIRSNSDKRPDLRGITSLNTENSSDYSEGVPGGTINTTNAGSGAMLGSTSGTSRDYERNPAFNRNRENEYNRGYGQGPGSSRNEGTNYGYGRYESQYRDQTSAGQNLDRDQYGRGQANASGSYYERNNRRYQQEQVDRRGENRRYEQDYDQPGNRHRQYQGGGQERRYHGQHRTHNQYQGGQGGHDYGQAPDWNQSHGSNWANENRNRQDQQRREQTRFGGYGQSSGFSRTGTTPTYSNQFEDQSQYPGDRHQNRNYEDINRDRDYRNQTDRDYNSGPGYGSESYNRDRNRNYGAGTGRGSGSYSGSSSYGGGGNFGAGHGPNRIGTPDYGRSSRESSRHQQDRHSYQDREYRNEYER